MPMIIQCPFFSSDKNLKTYCEGGTIRHPDALSRREYLQQFCASEIGWKKCTLAKSLEVYYDRK